MPSARTGLARVSYLAGSREVTAHLPGGPDSPAAARLVVATAARRWGLETLGQEAVARGATAVEAALAARPAPVLVRARLDDGELAVEVFATGDHEGARFALRADAVSV